MKKEGVFALVISVLLLFIVYFFLGVAYHISVTNKIFFCVIFVAIMYFFYRKIEEFYLFVPSLIFTYLAFEISFNFNLWLILFLSLVINALLFLAYRYFKFKGKYALLLLISFVVIWIILAFNVLYRSDWFLENYLTVPFVIILAISYRWFKLSKTSYGLIFAYMVLHIIGSHYTYSEVPFGFWMQSFFELSRNHYDRIVHFAFGLLLAYPLKEAFIGITRVNKFLAYYLPVEFVLAFSCIYEIIEWGVAIVFGGDLGVAYLGSQGDIWDSQKDMALAGLGSLIAMMFNFIFRKREKS